MLSTIRKKQPISFAVFFAVFLHISISDAQTSEQLEVLNDLTPAERAALLEGLKGTSIPSDTPIESPVVVYPRDPNGGENPTLRGALESEEVLELKQFGYALFAGEPTTFAPATDIPVPVDYVLGPGDTVDLQLFGNQSAAYSLVIGRDGVLNVPEIGPVSIAGLKFAELNELLQSRIAEQLIGVKASITLGPLRSIRIFVLGDVYRPGSYTVSALSTMTNALFVSGGISLIGSMRQVQLKRNGQTITTLDLYDLLLNGDTTRDRRLQPGDVIFIPPIGPTVGVAGAVRRPAIYEIDTERTTGELIDLAGGILASGYPKMSRIFRISPDRKRIVLDVDLSTEGGRGVGVTADDLITVSSVLDREENVVNLRGHVYREGSYQWRQGMRLSDVISTVDAIRPRADLEYVLIRRESARGQLISVLSVDLSEVLGSPGSADDILLYPQDEIAVFDLRTSRGEYLERILEELRWQASEESPSLEVKIGGRIRNPGTYPLEQGMRIADLVRAGGGLLESAYKKEAELTRYEIDTQQRRETKTIQVKLAQAMDGEVFENLELQPHDYLVVKETPLWRGTEVVTIEGEVNFPGNYPIRRGERLSDALSRAGGLTDLAFPEGAIFLRESLRVQEAKQLEALQERLESEITFANVGAADMDVDEETAEIALLSQLRETKATGRLVIDLKGVLLGDLANKNVKLRGGDRLLIPRASQTITVIGEVQFPTSHVFEPDITRQEYINLSGGTTSLADNKRIYIVRADGSVVTSRRSIFFRERRFTNMRPGDTIVVPIKSDPMSSLSLWTSVTTIIYNIGVAAAAVASF